MIACAFLYSQWRGSSLRRVLHGVNSAAQAYGGGEVEAGGGKEIVGVEVLVMSGVSIPRRVRSPAAGTTDVIGR